MNGWRSQQMIVIDCEILHAEFPDKVNVITGENSIGNSSGRGKTFLFSRLKELWERREVECNKRLVLLENVAMIRDMAIDDDRCFILDEANFAPKDLEYLLWLAQTTGGSLIVIGRMYVKQLTYSVDAIYGLKYDGERFELYKLSNSVGGKSNVVDVK